MYFNSQIEAWIVPKFTCCNRNIPPDEKADLITNQKQKESSGMNTDIDGDSSGGLRHGDLFIYFHHFA